MINRNFDVISAHEAKERYGYDIKNLSLFKGVEDSELIGNIARGVDFAKFKKGQFVFRTGDHAEQLYLVVDGHVKIFYNTPEGKEQMLYVYNNGDFIGGLNLLSEDDYRYMGQCLSDSVFAIVKKEAFIEHALQSPIVLKHMLSKSYERIRWAEDLISRLTASNASIKAAWLILKLKDEFATLKDGEYVLNLPMNREDMGSFAGLTRETITRKLTEFKERGIIDFKGPRTLIIKDIDALRAFII